MPFFSPVEMDNYFFVDGGIKENLPISVFDDNEIIVGVDLFPLKKSLKKNFFGILKHMFFLSWRVSSECNMKKCDFYIIDDNLLNFPPYSLKNLDNLFEIGYKNGKEFINSLD
jgi:NTE family protein